MSSAVATMVDHEVLVDLGRRVFEDRGVASEDAAWVARAIVETDLRGIDSHGVTRLPQYAAALDAGAFDAAARPTVVSEVGAVARIDGRAAMGHLAARAALDKAVELARDHGVGIVTVHESNPFGAAFLYPLRATGHDMIGFVTTNGPPVMPVHGAREPTICNNPLAWGIPTLEDPAIVLDMACMVAARGKVTLAAREGRAIPEGWALDGDGRPTTDPMAALAGQLLPLGGAKGSGLAVVNEVLAGALAGARVLAEVPATVVETNRFDRPIGIGHFVMAVDPEAWMPVVDFKRRVEDVRRMLRAAPPAPGVERVLLPGEPEHLTRITRLETGIPIAADTLARLRSLDSAGALAS